MVDLDWSCTSHKTVELTVDVTLISVDTVCASTSYSNFRCRLSVNFLCQQQAAQRRIGFHEMLSGFRFQAFSQFAHPAGRWVQDPDDKFSVKRTAGLIFHSSSHGSRII